MDLEIQLSEISSKVWSYRKTNGFTKKLSLELQTEIARLCQSGITSYALEKATGVQRNTIADWKTRLADKDQSNFSELSVVENSKPNFQVKLTGEVQGCHVEITGTDYNLLHRLFKKMV